MIVLLPSWQGGEDLCFCTLFISTFPGLRPSLCELKGQSSCGFWQYWMIMFCQRRFCLGVHMQSLVEPTFDHNSIGQTDGKIHCQQQTEYFWDSWFTTRLVRRYIWRKWKSPNYIIIPRGCQWVKSQNLNWRVQMEINNTISKHRLSTEILEQSHFHLI